MSRKNLTNKSSDKPDRKYIDSLELGYRPLQTVSNKEVRQQAIKQGKCGKSSCKGMDVEHIIDRNGPTLKGCRKDIAGNMVMIPAHDNRHLGAVLKNNPEKIKGEKIMCSFERSGFIMVKQYYL
jgi:hypothetical protein